VGQANGRYSSRGTTIYHEEDLLLG
jgi:hypothetical protein